MYVTPQMSDAFRWDFVLESWEVKNQLKSVMSCAAEQIMELTVRRIQC